MIPLKECNHYIIKYGGRLNYIEEFVNSTVCNESNGYVDPLDEGICVDDEDAPVANYSVDFITSENM